MHPWVWGRMRLYGVQGTQSVRADDEPETRPNHRGGGQHSTVDHHRKASKAAHFSRKSAAPRLHRRLEKILPIEFFFRLRDRLLSAMGWHVVSIPFFEWDRLHQAEQRDAYVEHRVHRSV